MDNGSSDYWLVQLQPLITTYIKIQNIWMILLLLVNFKEVVFLCADSSNTEMPMMWIFPYFLEPRILECFPSFTMLDYQVYWRCAHTQLADTCLTVRELYCQEISMQYLSVLCLFFLLKPDAQTTLTQWGDRKHDSGSRRQNVEWVEWTFFHSWPSVQHSVTNNIIKCIVIITC